LTCTDARTRLINVEAQRISHIAVSARTMTPSAVGSLVGPWRRSLRARNLSEKTISTYTDSAAQFARYLDAEGLAVTTVREITRGHVEGFLAGVLAVRRPATAHAHHRALVQFFKWCGEEGEIHRSPMEFLRPPIVPEVPVAVIADDELRRLLKSCEGRDFVSRRDTAILRLLIDTGMRRGELSGMTIDNLDLDQQVAFVVGKGRRPRAAPFGARTAVALDRLGCARVRARRLVMNTSAGCFGRRPTRCCGRGPRSGGDGPKMWPGLVAGRASCGRCGTGLVADRRHRRRFP